MKELALTARYLPAFDFRDYHQRTVPAGVDAAWAALRRLDLSRSRLVRAIFGVRTLPSLLRGEAWGAPRGPFLEQALALGWRILEEEPGSELAAGAVTRPWEPVVTFRGLPAEGFVAFEEAGFVKIVWGLAAWPAGAGSVIATETRVLATDEASRARFRRYWLVLGTGIKLIRRLALAGIRRDCVR
jgi:hypothetical protein